MPDGNPTLTPICTISAMFTRNLQFKRKPNAQILQYEERADLGGND
jgi:hypothetical protein